MDIPQAGHTRLGGLRLRPLRVTLPSRDTARSRSRRRGIQATLIADDRRSSNSVRPNCWKPGGLDRPTWSHVEILRVLHKSEDRNLTWRGCHAEWPSAEDLNLMSRNCHVGWPWVREYEQFPSGDE